MVDYLSKSATKSLCRPVVLLLNFGWQRNRMLDTRSRLAWNEEICDGFAPQQSFVPQRAIAVRRFKFLFAIGCVFGLVILVSTAIWWINR